VRSWCTAPPRGRRRRADALGGLAVTGRPAERAVSFSDLTDEGAWPRRSSGYAASASTGRSHGGARDGEEVSVGRSPLRGTETSRRTLDRPEPADDRPPGHGRGADRSARRAPSGVRVDERGRRPHRNGRRQGGLVLGHHDEGTTDEALIARLSGEIASLVGDGTDVVVVTRCDHRRLVRLGRPGPRSEDLSVLQAVSAVASTLMRSWEDGLAPHGLLAGQVLLARSTSCTASSTSTPGHAHQLLALASCRWSRERRRGR